MSAVKAAARPPAEAARYDEDVYTWTQEQGERLQAGDLDGLEPGNLAEEIESLGRSRYDSLVSLRGVVLLHMPRFDHQPEKRTRSWTVSIRTHRNRAADVLEDNPGLKSRLDQALTRAYRDAREEAAVESGLPLKVLSEGIHVFARGAADTTLRRRSTRPRGLTSLPC